MSSPTPTPLSTAITEVAMEAAREITGYIPTDWDPFYIAAKQKKILDDAAIIQKHFQPLLAKVEGERDAVQTQLSVALQHLNVVSSSREEWAKDHTTISVQLDDLAMRLDLAVSSNRTLLADNCALRADLAAKEAVLEAITRRVPIMASTGDYREGQLHALEACRDVARSALASRADKGGAR